MSQGYTPQQVYEQYQAAINQLQMVDNQAGQLKTILTDLELSISTINGFSTDKEVILPISGTVLLKTKLSENSQFMVSLGSGVVLPTSKEEGIELLEDKRKEILELLNRLEDDKFKLESIVQTLQYQLEQYERRS